MFCSQCGNEVNQGASFCGQCGARLTTAGQLSPAGGGQTGAGGKEPLLQAVEQALATCPQLVVSRSSKTDLEIRSVLADASWGVGKKKVEYAACLLVKEAERTVVYWEMLKEVGAGMGVFAGFKVEKYKSDGRTISGKVREVGYGPGGKAIDYTWDYSQIRVIVKNVVKAAGWKFKMVLWRGKAMY